MTADRHSLTKTRVVVAAGGLGTRVHRWARYLPKEFLPVNGRPGIVHVLEEITQLGPTDTVIVYHPYYEPFATWARHALSPKGHTRYVRATGRSLQLRERIDEHELTLDFVAQHGRYADLTSVINGVDHFAASHLSGEGTGNQEMYVVFSDNLYPDTNPLLALRQAPAGVAVLARAYQPELAHQRGVIITTTEESGTRMVDLIEKPDHGTARSLERYYGTTNLGLLEGRARITNDFVKFARAQISPPGIEPKLSLTVRAYARSRPVHVIRTHSGVIDLGAPISVAERHHSDPQSQPPPAQPNRRRTQTMSEPGPTPPSASDHL